MNMLVQIIKMAAVLTAAIMLGNWFLKEVKIARARQKPWYAPYLSPPGIVILMIAVGLPLALWYLRRG